MDIVIQAIIISATTALITGLVSAKVMESKLKDLTDRVRRIEGFLNGILSSYGKKIREE